MANTNFSSSATSAARTPAPDPTDSYDAIKGDIASLTESVKKLATEHMGSAVDGAQDQIKQTLGGVEASIRKNPTQAALVAAGIGFLVGLVMVR